MVNFKCSNTPNTTARPTVGSVAGVVAVLLHKVVGWILRGLRVDFSVLWFAVEAVPCTRVSWLEMRRSGVVDLLRIGGDKQLVYSVQ